jgi:branched-chain amino acid transport system substrate-binding protein
MIAIGVGAPLSGRAAALGNEMRQAVEMAAEEWNSNGGIAGEPIRILAVDDEGDVSKGGIAARELAADPEVVGVVGHYNSDVTIGATVTYRASGLVMITPVASNPIVTDRGAENVFRFTNRDDATGRALARHLYHALDKRHAVVVESETMYGKSMGGAFGSAFLQLGGRVLFHRPVLEGERDFTPLIDSLPTDFDVLFYGGAFEGAGLLKAMRAAGVQQLFAAGDGCWDVQNFLEPAREDTNKGEGVLILSATPETGRVSGSAEFARRYEQRFGPIGNYAVNAFDAASLLLDAILRASETNRTVQRDEVLSAVRSAAFRGIAYPGLVEWDDKGDNAAALTALHDVKDGRFRQIAQFERERVRAFSVAS